MDQSFYAKNSIENYQKSTSLSRPVNEHTSFILCSVLFSLLWFLLHSLECIFFRKIAPFGSQALRLRFHAGRCKSMSGGLFSRIKWKHNLTLNTRQQTWVELQPAITSLTTAYGPVSSLSPLTATALLLDCTTSTYKCIALRVLHRQLSSPSTLCGFNPFNH